MNGRYDEFMRHQRLVRQLETAVTNEELGRALIELGIEILGLGSEELKVLYPGLFQADCLKEIAVLADHPGA